MTQQEVRELVSRLKEKKSDKMKLTILELCILDMSKVLEKEGKEITEEDIQMLKFWMD